MALKPKWIVGIIFGSLMIYLSIFGLTGILYALINPVYEDDFRVQAGSNWSALDASPTWKTTEDGGIGYIQMDSTTASQDGVLRDISVLDSAAVATAEIRIRWSSFVSAGIVRWLTVLNQRIFCVVWQNGKIQSYPSGGGGAPPWVDIASFTPVTNTWYKFTVQCDKTTGTMKLYKDNVAYTTVAYYYDAAITYNALLGQYNGGVVDVDYIQTTIDKQEPAGGSGPLIGVSQGTLKVFTFHSNSTGDYTYPSASFTVSGPNSFSATWQTDANGFVQKDNLEIGTYSFTATGMTSASGTVTAGLSTAVTLRWPTSDGGGPSPSDWWAQIVAAIQQILTNAITVNALRWIGVLITVASTLMFINLGSLMKRKQQPIRDYRTHR